MAVLRRTLWLGLVVFTGLLGCGGLYEDNPLYEGSGTEEDTQTETETGPGTTGGPEGMVSDGEQPPGFWIDAREISVADYASFLLAEAVAPPPGQPRCAFKTDYTPGEWAMQESSPQRPIVHVDWCDAYAYCAWADKRLCAGNPTNPFAHKADENEWFQACSNEVFNNYPYATDYDPVACNGAEKGFGEPISVGALPGCEGGFTGLFDMSGNVWEWTGACDVEVEMDEEVELCARRGGSYFSDETLLQCDAHAEVAPTQREAYVGFRCCADPEPSEGS